MTTVWNAGTYDSERRRLVPCFDQFYGTATEIVERSCATTASILDLGAGTGILSGAILRRIPGARLTLLDASGEMLQAAVSRLADSKIKVVVQSLEAPLPRGPFDAVVSALAIHHLNDEAKRCLYRRILDELSPGGVFVNAEQVLGRTDFLQRLFEDAHLGSARALGSTEAEIRGAVERMKYDRCATVTDQIAWLREAGYKETGCFFRWFRFAVFGGWKVK